MSIRPIFSHALLKKSGLKRIPINIWDDYEDDGAIPPGKVQETWAYVESSLLSTELMDDVLRVFCETLNKKHRVRGVSFALRKRREGALEIAIKGLTHAERIKLVRNLKKERPTYQGVVLDVYSES